MNLKGRYSLLFVVMLTFLLVFYMPYGTNEPKCKKCLDCSELLNEISALPNIQQDLVVMRSSEIGNKTFDELRLLRLKQILNEQSIEQQGQAEKNQSSEQKRNSMLDCVTQNKIVIKENVKAYSKTVFRQSENRALGKEKENVTSAREKWLREFRNIHQDVQELVALNIIVTQLKLYLGKEFITVLDIFCGNVQHTNMLEFVRNRDDIHYTCIDTSLVTISENKKMTNFLGKNTHFHQYNVLEHGLNRQFDLVLTLSTIGFLDKEQRAALLYTVSQSKSSFMLVDFELINHSILMNLQNNEPNVPQFWDLASQPNQLDLDFPYCMRKMRKSGKVWSLWELPLQQITTKT